MQLAAQSQELRQLRLDIEKLAQFKAMLSEMKSGYLTLKDGYHSILDGSKKNYDLHKNFLDGLLNVNAAVRSVPALQNMNANQRLTLNEYKKAKEQFWSIGLFNPRELTEMDETYASLLKNISANLDLVAFVLTPGRLRMSDGERIAEIEKLEGDSERQLEALRNLTKENTAIAILRAQQKRDSEALRRLSGLK